MRCTKTPSNFLSSTLSGSRAKRVAADRLEVVAKTGIADGALALKRGHDRGAIGGVQFVERILLIVAGRHHRESQLALSRPRLGA